jgi:hypothetical protein
MNWVENVPYYEYQIFLANLNKKIEELTEAEVQANIERAKQSHIQTFESPMSEYDIKLTRLIITMNLIRSFEAYTLPTDRIQRFSVKGSANGTLVISSSITRGDESFFLETDVIYAGGWNIQRLHYRYITKTNLPKSGRDEKTKEASEEIKKLSKFEKINSEIEGYQKRISKNNEVVKSSEILSDEEILKELQKDKNWIAHPTWEEIIKRGADKNYDYNETIFYQKQNEYTKSKIDFWKKQNIEWPKRNTQDLKKEIEKLNKKLSALI